MSYGQPPLWLGNRLFDDRLRACENRDSITDQNGIELILQKTP
jgi:hypothetical protein